MKRTKRIVAVSVLSLAVATGGTLAGVEITQLTGEVKKQQGIIEKLGTDLSDAVILQKETSQTLDDLNVKYDSLANENKTLKDSLTQTNQQLEESNKKVDELTSKNQSLSTELQKEQNEVARLKKIKAASASKQNTTSNSNTVSRGSAPSQGKTLTVEATAYTAYCNGCSGTTATGFDLRANPGAKVIAVDPRVIPLGTKVYVPGYGYAVAADTGGAIKGNKIDVFIPSKEEMRQWGRKQVTITILN